MDLKIVGECFDAYIPEEDYMVDISGRLCTIRKMIDDGNYFVINRGRQYGKTTTLFMLRRYLEADMNVISISFEAADDMFVSGRDFVNGFIKKVANELQSGNETSGLVEAWSRPVEGELWWNELSSRISTLCQNADKPVVLMIDEVDKSSDNQIFLTFLGLLRDMFLERRTKNRATFRSVILAGVYDIRSLKIKLRPEDEHKYNSPWNIAVPFNVQMSFSADDIAGMLEEYEADHKTGMDVQVMARCIFDYTAGYPFFVSRLCQMIDETESNWECGVVADKVRQLVSEKMPIFDSMKNRLIDHNELCECIKRILFSGDTIPDNPDDEGIALAKMFGFIKAESGRLVIFNRIFEIRLYNYFTTTMQSINSDIYKAAANDKNIFINDGKLDMDLIIERFAVNFNDIYGTKPEPFIEEEGRKYFLLFLKPIINGTGNYYIEAETRDRTRTDVIVDYLGEQYIIELKIWRGDAYNRRGEKQIVDYLDYYHKNKGWLVSFCFNKEKKIGVHTVELAGKTIIEAVV